MSEVDDLLAGDTPPAKKAAAKKPAAKAAPTAPVKKAGGKAAPAKEAPAKKAAAKAAPAAKKEKGDGGAAAVAIMKLKSKKPIPYSEIAEKTGLDIRSIRRASRALRDEGKVELVKEGTKVSVKIVAAI